MKKLNIPEAYKYYRAHIYRKARFNLLREHNISISGSVPPCDWELFGAILTGDSGRAGYGCDLGSHEVKSAREGGSFEYQYHLNSGLKKLDEDKIVGHIFISYSPEYRDLTVRLVPGKLLADTFESWREGLKRNYEEANPRQRYRKNITYAMVAERGTIIMRVRGGKLVTEGPE